MYNTFYKAHTMLNATILTALNNLALQVALYDATDKDSKRVLKKLQRLADKAEDLADYCTGEQTVMYF
jgi:hypothetical protein